MPSVRHRSAAILRLTPTVTHFEAMLCRTLHSLVRCSSTWGARRGDCELIDVQDRRETASSLKGKGKRRAVVVRSAGMIWYRQAPVSKLEACRRAPANFTCNLKAARAVSEIECIWLLLAALSFS